MIHGIISYIVRMKMKMFFILILLVNMVAVGLHAESAKTEGTFFKRGIYINAYIAGDRKYMTKLLDKFDGLINTLVIDMKDSHGTVTYKSKLKMVEKVGSGGTLIKSLNNYVKQLKAKGYYLVARIVVFRDPIFARYKGSKFGVKVKGTKRLFTDENGFIWVDPFSEAAWQYNIDIAKEVAEAGFDEIQFDYVRFPSYDGSSIPFFAFQRNKDREEAVQNFLMRARKTLAEENVKISVAIFGYTTWHNSLPREGQHLYRIGNEVDVVYPMLYPSHFADDFLFDKIKEKRTYDIVFQSLKRAFVLLRHTDCKLIPYIQGFNWKMSRLGKDYIGIQMTASEDAGASGWIVWNAKGEYEDTYKSLINHCIKVATPKNVQRTRQITESRNFYEKKCEEPDITGIEAILCI